jgi:hypothetical protein
VQLIFDLYVQLVSAADQTLIDYLIDKINGPEFNLLQEAVSGVGAVVQAKR